jgi:hypothetical protein
MPWGTGWPPVYEEKNPGPLSWKSALKLRSISAESGTSTSWCQAIFVPADSLGQVCFDD